MRLLGPCLPLRFSRDDKSADASDLFSDKPDSIGLDPAIHAVTFQLDNQRALDTKRHGCHG